MVERKRDFFRKCIPVITGRGEENVHIRASVVCTEMEKGVEVRRFGGSFGWMGFE